MLAALLPSVISLGASFLSSRSANRASDQATAAMNQGYERANQAYQGAQQTIDQNTAPWLELGNQALGQLAAQYGLGGGASGGSPDWGLYVQQNPDVLEIQEIANGQRQGTQDQINFLNDWQRSGLSLGEYHNQAVGGRAVPTTGAQQQAQPAYSDPGRGDGAYAQPYSYGRQLDTSIGAYQQSPDYQFQLSEGSKAVTQNKAVSGLLESGSALKALTSYAQNLANGDYTGWRGYVTGQYNTDRDYGLKEYTSNRDYATNRYDSYIQGLSGFANTGFNAQTQRNTAATGYANALASSAQGQGQANAYNAAYKGVNNANMISNIGGALGKGAANSGLDFASLLSRGGSAFGGAATGIYPI